MTLTQTILAVLLAFSPGTLLGAQVNVPEQWPTIQEAVDQASAGDVISVGPGNWNQTVDLKGKPITLIGRAGAAKTILDGGGLGRSIIRCATGEKASTIIDGFTLVNGTGDTDLYGTKSAVGGGIVILGASPIIRNCVFKSNDVNYQGGAVYMARESAPVFDSCIFFENAAEKGGDLRSPEQAGIQAMRVREERRSLQRRGGLQLRWPDHQHGWMPLREEPCQLLRWWDLRIRQ